MVCYNQKELLYVSQLVGKVRYLPFELKEEISKIHSGDYDFVSPEENYASSEDSREAYCLKLTHDIAKKFIIIHSSKELSVVLL